MASHENAPRRRTPAHDVAQEGTVRYNGDIVLWGRIVCNLAALDWEIEQHEKAKNAPHRKP